MARWEPLWQPYMVRGTIGDAVFGPAGPLAARTTYGVTGHIKMRFSRMIHHSIKVLVLYYRIA